MRLTPTQREYQRRYYRLNRVKRLAQARAWHLANPEKAKQACQTWRKNHPEEEAERVRKFREAHPELSREYNKAYRQRHPDKAKEHAWRSSGIQLKFVDFLNLLRAQGGKCAFPSCGTDLKPFDRNTCVDHDHKTGKIRGLLCRRHNSLLGRAGNNRNILRDAIAYLNQFYGN